ncbi:MAG: hypothetical protein J0I43_13375 [Microbacterium sp.]|uniref:hypothetical protein n=1 Tax=Microbacterium sp. TaxID=51671 RepID=UPI001AD5B6FF|nr:hypothetical protein [Microbacterium sp.]MBN9178340.1 hypothetical protein [Microbacterium sp.]
MSQPRDPAILLPNAFTVAQARDAGVPRGRLRGASLSRPFHGVRVRGTVETNSLRASCHALLPRLRPGQFFSHETALAVHGVWMPEWPYRPAIHVSAYRPAREPRTRGVIGHRLQLREPAWTLLDGLPVEAPVRAWRQVGGLWSPRDIVAAADFLVSGSEPLASAVDLRDEITRMGDVRRGILTRALHDVRTGVRSARETRLRLLLMDAGLPEPEVAWNVFDGRGTFVAELDLAFPRYRVAAEYDGRVHAEDAAQFARDADRWAAIRRAGWAHERILAHHLDGDGRAAVGIVRDALVRAGWTPGR